MVHHPRGRGKLDVLRGAEVLELARERGVLLGKGGLHGNTLRIKPPMCLTRDDADFLVDCLDEVLESLPTEELALIERGEPDPAIAVLHRRAVDEVRPVDGHRREDRHELEPIPLP